MASTITAGNATNGLGVTSDNTGILELKTGTGSGTTALTLNASQNATLAGTLQVAGVATNMYPLVSGTAKAWNWNGLTTNKEIDFTGIPSWAQRVTVMFSGVSLSGTSNALVQIGTSSGVENTGYSSSSGYIVAGGATTVNSSTAGFVVSFVAAANVITAVITINLLTSNTWVSAHSGSTGGSQAINGGGNKTLSGTLDRVRITTVNGTDNFDAGTINIMWE